MSPQYHSASCRELPAPPSLVPPPTPPEGCWGLGGRAAGGEDKWCVYYNTYGLYDLIKPRKHTHILWKKIL